MTANRALYAFHAGIAPNIGNNLGRYCTLIGSPAHRRAWRVIADHGATLTLQWIAEPRGVILFGATLSDVTDLY